MSLRDFYNSPAAEEMANAYNNHCVVDSVSITLPRETAQEILDALHNLRKFYNQKLIPGKRRAWLDELIAKVDQHMV